MYKKCKPLYCIVASAKEPRGSRVSNVNYLTLCLHLHLYTLIYSEVLVLGHFTIILAFQRYIFLNFN